MSRDNLTTQHDLDKQYGNVPPGFRAISRTEIRDVAALFAADRPKLTLDQVREVKRLLLDGRLTRVQISEQTGVSRMSILAIEKGRFWYV